MGPMISPIHPHQCRRHPNSILFFLLTQDRGGSAGATGPTGGDGNGERYCSGGREEVRELKETMESLWVAASQKDMVGSELAAVLGGGWDAGLRGMAKPRPKPKIECGLTYRGLK